MRLPVVVVITLPLAVSAGPLTPWNKQYGDHITGYNSTVTSLASVSTGTASTTAILTFINVTTYGTSTYHTPLQPGTSMTWQYPEPGIPYPTGAITSTRLAGTGTGTGSLFYSAPAVFSSAVTSTTSPPSTTFLDTYHSSSCTPVKPEPTDDGLHCNNPICQEHCACKLGGTLICELPSTLQSTCHAECLCEPNFTTVRVPGITPILPTPDPTREAGHTITWSTSICDTRLEVCSTDTITSVTGSRTLYFTTGTVAAETGSIASSSCTSNYSTETSIGITSLPPPPPGYGDEPTPYTHTLSAQSTSAATQGHSATPNSTCMESETNLMPTGSTITLDPRQDDDPTVTLPTVGQTSSTSTSISTTTTTQRY
ncbi:hypothetical protein SCAR479_09889 [Seiridium cardinale]|uniref:Uncharacterized protein n=1 Tax=Seiridium cardinale TaxID=138064 RepID=A0ABR2XHT3_9PEZI